MKIVKIVSIAFLCFFASLHASLPKSSVLLLGKAYDEIVHGKYDSALEKIESALSSVKNEKKQNYAFLFLAKVGKTVALDALGYYEEARLVAKEVIHLYYKKIDPPSRSPILYTNLPTTSEINAFRKEMLEMISHCRSGSTRDLLTKVIRSSPQRKVQWSEYVVLEGNFWKKVKKRIYEIYEIYNMIKEMWNFYKEVDEALNNR